MNRKRTQRLYREEGLSVRRRRGRKSNWHADTKECLAAIPDTSISGRRVARELADVIRGRVKPDLIVSRP